VRSRGVPLPIAVACGVGCGKSPEEEVRAALEDYTGGLRDKDVETACDKLFSSALLPAVVVDRLELDTAGSPTGTPAQWEAENRACREGFDGGEFESAAPPDDASVVDVTVLESFEDIQEITGAARARVRWGDRSDTTALVRFDDDWKVVFVTR
jgi:hypothetical protein